jgi:hypothetical protein
MLSRARITMASVAGLCALVLLIWAVWMAALSREPWGDSARAFYAAVAVFLLALGVSFLVFLVRELRRLQHLRDFILRWQPLVGVLAVVAVAIPLVTSSTHSLSFSAEHFGPPVATTLVGGIGLAVGLGALMIQRVWIGLGASAVVAALLLAVAFATAR